MNNGSCSGPRSSEQLSQQNGAWSTMGHVFTIGWERVGMNVGGSPSNHGSESNPHKEKQAMVFNLNAQEQKKGCYS